MLVKHNANEKMCIWVEKKKKKTQTNNGKILAYPIDRCCMYSIHIYFFFRLISIPSQYY